MADNGLPPDGRVSFFLNGRRVDLDQPAPSLLLIDYLRGPEVGLVGPKKPCGQGGCGGCTVILSDWDTAAGRARHAAINACLRPVASLNGLVITTVEGTGSVRRPNPSHPHQVVAAGRGVAPQGVLPPAMADARDAAVAKRDQVLTAALQAQRQHGSADAPPAARLRGDLAEAPSERSQEGMNPIAWRLAINNGTQCGYCTVGFVMNMSEFLANHPQATKREIEEALDGNLCRCTGYRSIVTGMHTFASDWTPQDEAERMKCLPEPEAAAQRPTGDLVIPFPDAAREPASGATLRGQGLWLSPTSLAELARMAAEHPDARLTQGNTSSGVYTDETEAARDRISLAYVRELFAPPRVTPDALEVPAGMSYARFMDELDAQIRARGELERGPDGAELPPVSTALGALRFMAHRTAGRIVRNAASLGGNTMLVLAHLRRGAPFPSDLATALVAVGATLDVAELDGRGGYRTRHASLVGLIEECLKDEGLHRRLVLLRYRVPLRPAGPTDDVLLPQKVALRDINAHSIVNHCALLQVREDGQITGAALSFGGIAPYPWLARRTAAAMTGQRLSLASVQDWARLLAEEVKEELARWADRLHGLPDEGFSDSYRTTLAVAALYKDVVHALTARGGQVPPADRSAGVVTWGRWAPSTGRQSFKSQAWKAPVAQPFIKVMAMEQASGQVRYAHELPMPPRTLQASPVLSARALADWRFDHPDHDLPPDGGDPARAAERLAVIRQHLSERFPGFVDLITQANIPAGGINLMGMGSDQPVFANGPVQYVGQVLALVLASSELEARRIADFVGRRCVRYAALAPKAGEPPWWSRPVLDLEDALAVGSVYPDWPQTAIWPSHIWRITRPGSRFEWSDYARPPLDKALTRTTRTLAGASCVVVGGTQRVGGQIHFYMEPQAALVEPADGRRFTIRPSTQSPMEMHQTAAMSIGVQHNAIEVDVPPVGGGFGGKTEQAKFVTAAATVAAYATKLPVRLTLSREQDTAMIGKRHGLYGQYQVAIDDGSARAEDRGLLRGVLNRMWMDGGAFYDCSFIVANCIQGRSENAYLIANFESQVDVCRTNTAPSTAFRAFGDVQSKLVLETAIDDAAFAIGMRPEDVREKNLYRLGDTTPFGQPLGDCYIRTVWDYLKQVSEFERQSAEAEAFNAANRWRKRAVAMLPVKYGSGYNLVNLEQAVATISIYQGDGTLVIHQGGVEMGQGLVTQMRQIAAYILNVPMEMIQVMAPRTAVIPNPTSTGGSTGTAYNGEAVKRLCARMRDRLAAFAQDLRDENGPDWCREQGIDFWNYPRMGWRARVGGPDLPDDELPPVIGPDGTPTPPPPLLWQKLVALAYARREPLVEAFTAPVRGGETPCTNLGFKPYDQQPRLAGYHAVPGQSPGEFDQFMGFTYSGACVTVEVDILTGETKILRADLVYDMGWSLNPAVDIGQVEGAFMQGTGFVLSEQLVFEPTGDEAGRLNTLNTWTYKPPAVTSIPLVFNTHLFPRDLAQVPAGPNDGILSSKEVGEPPLVLAATVFLAVKRAVRASRLERGLSERFDLAAPATVQEVSRACELREQDLAG
ncbi:molybdopterin cofactor-binding domain-containing protein [Roseateles chitosanitabidus]|uniref:molybdopterin cofactor-binding domain-containing protein n=1 Tax=Roseateles chitosanitabidus TaxID=65048 RepID=UPI00082C88AF|nr:molybdopterin cofactor-binding domain-containing protein [Roseateles chitosanitabidus]